MLFKILLALILLGMVPAHAEDIRRTVMSVASTDTLNGIYTTMTPASTSTVYSKSISLVNHGYESVGVMYKATSSGVIALTVQPQRSFDRPTTESANNAAYVPWNAPFTISDNLWHMATLDTVVMPYVRFQITGTGSNDSSTTIQMKLEQQ